MNSDDDNLPKSTGKLWRRRAEVEMLVRLVRGFPANTAFKGRTDVHCDKIQRVITMFQPTETTLPKACSLFLRTSTICSDR